MERELSYKELSEHFQGPSQAYLVRFHTGQYLDIGASREAQVRVYHQVPYITKYFKDIVDRVSKRATPEQMTKHAAEFLEYQERIDHGDETPYDGYPESGRQDRDSPGGREHESDSVTDCPIPFPKSNEGSG